MSKNNLQPLLEQVNRTLAAGSYFYLSNDPERSLGLEDLLSNFHGVFIDKSQFTDYFSSIGVNYFCLEDKLQQMNLEFRSSLKLIKHPLFRDYFQQHKAQRSFVQTFKISPAFEHEVAGLGATLINTSGQLNRLFETKLSQYQQLATLGISLPKTVLVKLGDADFASLAEQLGTPLVIQFNRGHTGSGTYYINSSADLAPLQDKFAGRMVKVSEFIKGKSYTLNACVTSAGIFMGGLSFQITGIPTLTSEPGGTVGNDWEYRDGISETTLTRLQGDVTRIGEKMQAAGYRGLFGVDIVVRDEIPFVIEINARQPASIPMYTKIQLLKDEVPLSLLHIAEFLGISNQLDVKTYNQQALQPLGYSQVFIRALQSEIIHSQVTMGLYRLQSDNSAVDRGSGEVRKNTIFLDEDKDKPLVFVEAGYSFSKAAEHLGMLLLSPFAGRQVKRGQELGRIQIAQGVILDDGSLSKWIEEALLAIKHYEL